MATGHDKPEADLLHPLATLHWEHCHTPPWGDYWPRDCVVLYDRVAVLTMWTMGGYTDVVYISSTDLNSWTSSTLPCKYMSLSTYQSKFVAVGGYYTSPEEFSGDLFTSNTGLHWRATLPPMPTKRYYTSSVNIKSPEVLVVAGGCDSEGRSLDVVEVLLENHWTTVNSLPAPCYWMHSSLHHGNLYFIGGVDQDGVVYVCSCSSLISATKSTAADKSIWNQFVGPGRYSAARHTACVSFSLHFVSIDPECVIRAYSSVTQSWLEATRTGKWSHRNGHCNVAAGVLHTGEIVFAHEDGIYRVKLLMSSYDPDSWFISDVLSRLEAAMGIHINSMLDVVNQQLLTSSGVTLQPKLDKHGDKIPSPDPQTEPGLYVEEIIYLWSHGQSHRPPTWRQLLMVLRDIGLTDLSQQIETFMKVNADDARYQEAYRFFINNKESLALLFLKFLFLGPPRLGKSTTLRRLMGKIVDLKSAGEGDQEYPSTGAVESGAVLVRSVSNTTAIIAPSEWTALESVEDEASMLLHNLVDTLTSRSVTSYSVEVETHIRSTASVSEIPSSQPTNQSAAETGRIIQQLPPALPGAQATKQPQMSEVVAMIQKAMGSKYWKDVKQMFKAYLRVEDTGGQPELMDMLPALTIGPGLYLLFINLQNDLDHHYKLSYCNKSGTSTVPVESIYNIKEMLFSSLASIWCSSASSKSLTKNEGIIPGVSDILKTSKSKAYIVGTHKDMVTKDHIKKLNEQLQNIVESTEFSDIVEYSSQDELIVAVDNMAGGAEEVKKVQTLLEKCMTRCFTELKIPVVWLVLSLILRRKENRTVVIKDCMHLSEALGMSCYETEVALWFLHHHAGVLMHFPNIPELKDLVIVDVQIVYDSVTILILKALNWEEVGVHRARKFRNTGRFTIGQLTAITSKASGDFIPIKKLVVLLEYLHIIASISHQQKSSYGVEEVTYIMPCVLDSANKKELDIASSEHHEVCPIMVRFKCGFEPIGIFPAMIACLFNNQSFFVKEEGIKKNFVQFRYGVYRTLVTFIGRPMYYEFIISELFIPLIEVHKECFALRKEIETLFDNVFSRMNYSALVEYEFAFACPKHTNCERDHLCVVNREESVPVMMDCLQNLDNRVPVYLSDQHKLWYGQFSSLQVVSLPSQLQNMETSQDQIEIKCHSTRQMMSLDQDETMIPLSKCVCESNVNLFKKEMCTLVEVIHHSIGSVGDSCYSEDLVSDDTYDYLRLPAVTNRDKARKLLLNVKKVISQDPQALMKFLDILNKIDVCKDIVTKIQRSLLQ